MLIAEHLKIELLIKIEHIVGNHPRHLEVLSIKGVDLGYKQMIE